MIKYINIMQLVESSSRAVFNNRPMYLNIIEHNTIDLEAMLLLRERGMKSRRSGLPPWSLCVTLHIEMQPLLVKTNV